MLIFVFRRLRNKYNNLLIGYNVRYLSRNSVIFVTTRSQDNKHFKYNIKLPNVTEVKDLGIIVDHELKFKRHTGYYHQSTSASFTYTEMFYIKRSFFAVQGICDLRATTPGV